MWLSMKSIFLHVRKRLCEILCGFQSRRIQLSDQARSHRALERLKLAIFHRRSAITRAHLAPDCRPIASSVQPDKARFLAIKPISDRKQSSSSDSKRGLDSVGEKNERLPEIVNPDRAETTHNPDLPRW